MVSPGSALAEYRPSSRTNLKASQELAGCCLCSVLWWPPGLTVRLGRAMPAGSLERIRVAPSGLDCRLTGEADRADRVRHCRRRRHVPLRLARVVVGCPTRRHRPGGSMRGLMGPGSERFASRGPSGTDRSWSRCASSRSPPWGGGSRRGGGTPPTPRPRPTTGRRPRLPVPG